MHRGYIKLWRKLKEWEWFTDVNTCHLFIYLLLNVRNTDGSWRGIVLFRGEIIQSIDTMAERSGMTVRGVRTTISHLRSTGEVTERKQGKYRILKLTNYSIYHTVDKDNDRETIGKRQGNDRETTANKKEKKEEKDKNTTVVNKKMLTWLKQQGKGEAYADWMYRQYGEDTVNQAWQKATKGRSVNKPSDLVELCKTLSNK